MRLLFDECISRLLKSSFAVHGHECSTVPEIGLAGKKNGELLTLAEGRFDVFVTIDRNLRYQQNLTGRRLQFSSSAPSLLRSTIYCHTFLPALLPLSRFNPVKCSKSARRKLEEQPLVGTQRGKSAFIRAHPR